MLLLSLGTFRWGLLTPLFLLPLVTTFRPLDVLVLRLVFTLKFNGGSLIRGAMTLPSSCTPLVGDTSAGADLMDNFVRYAESRDDLVEDDQMNIYATTVTVTTDTSIKSKRKDGCNRLNCCPGNVKKTIVIKLENIKDIQYIQERIFMYLKIDRQC